jgi:protein involved in polysaccharide export with SLBB domain
LKNVQYLLFFLILLPAQTWGQDKAHLIGSQDVLTLSIYAGGELQREVDLTVSDENMVNIPFIGQVKAEKLIKGYHSLRNSISVEGEVKKPGVYDYQRGITALNACIMAGGFDKFAAPNRARIIRKENDKQVIIKINLNDVKEGKIPDIELKPGDLILIPETWL